MGSELINSDVLGTAPSVRLNGVGTVFELVRPVPSVLLLERHERLEHAAKLVRGVGEDDLCAEEAHHLAALNGKGL